MRRTFTVGPEDEFEGVGQLAEGQLSLPTTLRATAETQPRLTGLVDEGAVSRQATFLQWRQALGAAAASPPSSGPARAHQPRAVAAVVRPAASRSLLELVAHCKALCALLRVEERESRGSRESRTSLTRLLASKENGEAAARELLDRARAVKAEADNWERHGKEALAQALRWAPGMPFSTIHAGADDADEADVSVKKLSSFAAGVIEASHLSARLTELWGRYRYLSPLVSVAACAEAERETAQAMTTSDKVLSELTTLQTCVEELTVRAEKSTATIRANRIALQRRLEEADAE